MNCKKISKICFDFQVIFVIEYVSFSLLFVEELFIISINKAVK